MTLFRQIFHAASSEFMYLLGDPETREAVAVDCVPGAATVTALAMLAEQDLRLRYLLLTHTHAGAVPDTAPLVARTQCRIVAGNGDPAPADLRVGDGDYLAFGPEVVRVIGSPGHTRGSVSYLWRDRLFTGDALLIGCTSEPDPGDGDAAQFYDSVVQRLFALTGETLVFPARNWLGRTVSTIAEEREHHPDFIARSRDEFIARRRRIVRHRTPIAADSGSTPLPRSAAALHHVPKEDRK